MRPRNCPRFCREGSREWWVRIFLKATDDPWLSSLYANTLCTCGYNVGTHGKLMVLRTEEHSLSIITATSYRRRRTWLSQRSQGKSGVYNFAVAIDLATGWPFSGYWFGNSIVTCKPQITNTNQTHGFLRVVWCWPANCWRNMMSVTFKLRRAKWLLPRVLHMYIYASGEDPKLGYPCCIIV